MDIVNFEIKQFWITEHFDIISADVLNEPKPYTIINNSKIIDFCPWKIHVS